MTAQPVRLAIRQPDLRAEILQRGHRTRRSPARGGLLRHRAALVTRSAADSASPPRPIQTLLPPAAS